MNYSETLGLPNITVTAVGSMPHSGADDAVELILQSLPTAPHAPQLSMANPREQMWIQCSENLPRFVVDLDNIKYYFDTTGDYTSDIETFYGHYLDVMDGGSAEYFKIGPEYGKGIHVFFQKLRKLPKKPSVVKAQVTGPLSFALTIPDESGRAIFFHDTFRDIAVKGMAMKAIWLVDQLKNLSENVIIFYDEPCLSAYGSSAYMGVSRSDVIAALNETIDAATARGATLGVHCCGNTDWGLLMETNTRIVNFDAVDYMDTLPIYTPQLNDFLSRNGILAWGAVPNDYRLSSETAEKVIDRIQKGIDQLGDAGVDRSLLIEKLLITPACGCAGLTMDLAEKAYSIMSQLDTSASNGLLLFK